MKKHYQPSLSIKLMFESCVKTQLSVLPLWPSLWWQKHSCQCCHCDQVCDDRNTAVTSVIAVSAAVVTKSVMAETQLSALPLWPSLWWQKHSCQRCHCDQVCDGKNTADLHGRGVHCFVSQSFSGPTNKQTKMAAPRGARIWCLTLKTLLWHKCLRNMHMKPACGSVCTFWGQLASLLGVHFKSHSCHLAVIVSFSWAWVYLLHGILLFFPL